MTEHIFDLKIEEIAELLGVENSVVAQVVRSRVYLGKLHRKVHKFIKCMHEVDDDPMFESITPKYTRAFRAMKMMETNHVVKTI